MHKKLLSLLVTAAMASIGATAHAAVTDTMIENDAKTTGDVLSWGIGTQEGQRYSPLKKVNTAKTIEQAGAGVELLASAARSSAARSRSRSSTTARCSSPASYSRLFALDAKTGAKLWKYEHRLPDGIMPCCDVINRGAALYDNLVIFATLDAQLVALEPEHRRRGVEGEDRRLRGRLLGQRPPR